ncbi:MAG: S4 domain-containing protein, partial [Polyangiaceae bacterium]
MVARAHHFVAQGAESRERLDKYVVDRMAEAGDVASRSAVQRWIRAGRVTIGGKPANASDSVAIGATIDVLPLPPEPTDLAPDPSVVFDVLH